MHKVHGHMENFLFSLSFQWLFFLLFFLCISLRDGHAKTHARQPEPRPRPCPCPELCCAAVLLCHCAVLSVLFALVSILLVRFWLDFKCFSFGFGLSFNAFPSVWSSFSMLFMRFWLDFKCFSFGFGLIFNAFPSVLA